MFNSFVERMVAKSMKNRQVKVLLLANYDAYVYGLRLEIIKAFLDLGCEVVISCPYGNRIEDLKSLGCLCIETNFNRRGTSIKDDLKLISHYRQIMKVIVPHIVLTYTIKPNIYGGIAANREKIPVISNITGLGTSVKNKDLMTNIIIVLYRIAFKKVTCVFFQNEDNLKFFKELGIVRGREKLLPGSGVNLKKFSALPLPNNVTTSFVFIARIMKDKGIDHYLEAARIIRSKYENTEFHICGFCEDSYEDILNEYQKAGIIIYHGMVKDIRKVLKITHCTVHPSYHEGLSNVLLESAASSRPVIATNINGCKEVVEDNITGFLVEPRSTESLIIGIEKFLCLSYEERKRMGEKGRLKVEREFNRQIVVDAYLEVVNSIKMRR